jgi:hypothetical protein
MSIRTFVLNIVDKIAGKIVIIPANIHPQLHTHGDYKNLLLTATVYAIDIIQSNTPLYIMITIEGMHIDKYDDRYLHTHLHTHGDEK